MPRERKFKEYSMMNVIQAGGNVSIYEEYPYWVYLKVGECKTEYGPSYRMVITVKYITQANKHKKIKIYYYNPQMDYIKTMSRIVLDKIYRVMTNQYQENERSKDYVDIYLEVYYYERRTSVVKHIMGDWSLKNQIKLKYLDLYLLQ